LDQNNIVIANKFLEIAKEDLKAAEVLYVNELMRPSLYHLEQASEKILKAYPYWRTVQSHEVFCQYC